MAGGQVGDEHADVHFGGGPGEDCAEVLEEAGGVVEADEVF